MLTHNEFDVRKETILIEYNRVIKNSDQFLMWKLGNELYDLYKDTLNIERLKGISREDALVLTNMMFKPNVLDNFKKDSLPDGWIKSYIDLYFSYPDMWENCTLIDMGVALYNLASQKFVDKIILWSPFEDPRIEDDIHSRHKKIDKIAFAYGDLLPILETNPTQVTSFIIGDVSLVEDIAQYSQHEFTEILIAKYRFNLARNEEGRYETVVDVDALMDLNIKISEFTPATLKLENIARVVKY